MPGKQFWWVLSASVFSLIVGCGGNSPQVAYKKDAAAGMASPPAPGMMAPQAVVDRAMARQAPGAPEAARGGGKPAEAEPEPAIERKIIYSGGIDVTVKDLDKTRQEVEQLVEEYKGYIAKSEVTGDSGRRRVGTWTLKIPSAKFRLAMSALAKLGVTTKNSSDSTDVTEEFVDVQARLKNLKAEEEVLNKLLKDTVRLEDVLKLREQIKNIRGDIERAEGRLKYLSTMAALSTISFTAREEEEKYVPPTAPTPPTFLQSVETTFGQSWTSLQKTSEALALFLVALAPWLPVIVVGFLLVRFVLLRLFRTLERLFASEEAPPKAKRAAANQEELKDFEIVE